MGPTFSKFVYNILILTVVSLGPERMGGWRQLYAGGQVGSNSWAGRAQVARCLTDAEGPKSGGPGARARAAELRDLEPITGSVDGGALSLAFFTLNVRLLHFIAGRKTN